MPDTHYPHRHTISDTTDASFYESGHLVPAYSERLICLDCGADLTEPETDNEEIPY